MSFLERGFRGVTKTTFLSIILNLKIFVIKNAIAIHICEVDKTKVNKSQN